MNKKERKKQQLLVRMSKGQKTKAITIVGENEPMKKNEGEK
jgi:hypothetical protein